MHIGTDPRRLAYCRSYGDVLLNAHCFGVETAHAHRQAFAESTVSFM